MANRLTLLLCVAFSGAAVLAACGGGGGGNGPSRGLPPAGPMVTAKLTITIPLKGAAQARHRNTVSSNTQSISVVVNNGAPQVFNATPTSGGCTSGQTGTTCTFKILAPAGSDTFAVTTYDQVNAQGNALNGATTSATVNANGTDTVSIVLTTDYVSNTSDAGTNSLRAVVASASAGDTICFTTTGTIALQSPINIPINLTLDGSCPNTVTLDGGNAHQLLTTANGTNVTIRHLTLQNGLVALADGAAINSAGALTLDSDTFIGNKGTTTTNVAIHGGAVYSTGAVTILNSTFTNNSLVASAPPSSAPPPAMGGAVYVAAPSSVTVTGSTFSSNSIVADSNGSSAGALYAGASVTISGSTFKLNSSSGSGGALSGPETNATPIPYVATISNSTFDSNKAGSYSGAWEYDAGDATVDSTTFSNNSTTGTNKCCGAIGEFSGAVLAPGATYIVTFTNDIFSANVSTGDSGAMEVDSNPVLIANTQFLNNQSAKDSGAMEIDGCPTTILNNDTFTGNKALSFDGGALEIDCATNITGGSFTNNTAPSGGAVTVYDNTTITGATFSGNSATGALATHGGAGGAILAGWNLNLQNTTVSGNTASEVGGGIYVTCGTTISGSTISGNQVTGSAASDGGGGIYTYPLVYPSCPPTLVVTNSTIANNTSANDGGGLLNAGLTAALNFVTMAYNTATNNGWNIQNAQGAAGQTINAIGRRPAAQRRVPMAPGPTSPPTPITSISNSIVAASPHPGSDINNAGIMNGADYNIFFNAALTGTPFADNPQNFRTTDPLLGLLQNNGGATFTMAIGSGSSARDYVPLGACNVAADQRGTTRPQGPQCDSGAFEFP